MGYEGIFSRMALPVSCRCGRDRLGECTDVLAMMADFRLPCAGKGVVCADLPQIEEKRLP
jgi:hypothetical protein